MKKKTIMCVATLIVAAIVSITVVSCKKESLASLQKQDNPTKEYFNPQEIEDMNAYLKDFKQKMIESKADESLGIDEAAWHLSSLFNYDFANANVECDDVRFDTIYNTVNVTDGSIQLSDLAEVYEKAGIDIDKFYHSLMLENKHFRYIDCVVSEDGVVTITIITTSSNKSRWHYFADSTFCDYYFPQYSYSYSEATSELERVFNVLLGKDTIPSQTRTYYVKTREYSYYFKRWLEDPENYCPNEYHYRLFCTKGYFYGDLQQADVCYYEDSYCGLANDNRHFGEAVIYGIVEFIHGIIPEYEDLTDGIVEQQFGHHLLTVGYGYGVHANQNEY